MVYNRKDYYKEALDNLKEQSDKNFELIIVSNIPIEYDFSAFREVNVIPAPSNLLEAYILGMEASKNDIVAFLDDDDRFASYKISHLKHEDIQGYYHNNYYDFGSNEPHNNGKGFNASCIAVNKSVYDGGSIPWENIPNHESILRFAKDYPLLGYMPDSAIYWYALENNLSINIDNTKLTYYRHKPLKKMYSNILDSLNRQLSTFQEAEKIFKSNKVKDIIREGKIQNQIYLNSLGYYKKISIKDLIWLMRRPVIAKRSKVMSYFLSLPVWHGMGIKFIEKMRKRKMVEE